jgi:hypothetical protein
MTAKPILLIWVLLTIVFMVSLSLAEDKTAPEPGDAIKPGIKKQAPDGGKQALKKKEVGKVEKKPGDGRKSEFASIRAQYDQNQDGAVSLAEMQDHLPAGKDPASAAKWFQSRDRDQDGQLTDQDFAPVPPKKS